MVAGPLLNAVCFCCGSRRLWCQRLPVSLCGDLNDETGADAGGRRTLSHDAVPDRDQARPEEHRAG